MRVCVPCARTSTVASADFQFPLAKSPTAQAVVVRDLISQFRQKADIHESRYEIGIGEVVRAMARLGYPTVSFRLQGEGQLVQFRAVGHPTLYGVHVVFERPSGGAVTRAMVGSRVVLRITAEARCRSADSAVLVRLARSSAHRESAESFEGEIRVEREVSSLLAHTCREIDLDDHVGKGANGTRTLVGLLRTTIEALAAAIGHHKGLSPVR